MSVETTGLRNVNRYCDQDNKTVEIHVIARTREIS